MKSPSHVVMQCVVLHSSQCLQFRKPSSLLFLHVLFSFVQQFVVLISHLHRSAPSSCALLLRSRPCAIQQHRRLVLREVTCACAD